jgi:hypothetical protein
MRGDLQTARELAEQIMSLAQSGQDPVFLLWAHYGLGATENFLGEFASSRAHFEQGIALYDSAHHRSYTLLYGQDPGLGCLYSAAVPCGLSVIRTKPGRECPKRLP